MPDVLDCYDKAIEPRLLCRECRNACRLQKTRKPCGNDCQLAIPMMCGKMVEKAYNVDEHSGKDSASNRTSILGIICRAHQAVMMSL